MGMWIYWGLLGV